MVKPRDGASTWCPQCGALLIERDWYRLGRWHLKDAGHCADCGYELPGRFLDQPGHFGPQRIPLQLNRY